MKKDAIYVYIGKYLNYIFNKLYNYTISGINSYLVDLLDVYFL